MLHAGARAGRGALYVGPVYTQHNPLAPDGAEAFVRFVEAFLAQFSHLHVDFKRTAAEGDLVAVHAHPRAR
jgi:predicted SnoaL-like aldol condensation-catalyzing enzyme